MNDQDAISREAAMRAADQVEAIAGRYSSAETKARIKDAIRALPSVQPDSDEANLPDEEWIRRQKEKQDSGNAAQPSLANGLDSQRQGIDAAVATRNQSLTAHGCGDMSAAEVGAFEAGWEAATRSVSPEVDNERLNEIGPSWNAVEMAEGLASPAIGKLRIPEWRAMVTEIASALDAATARPEIDDERLKEIREQIQKRFPHCAKYDADNELPPICMECNGAVDDHRSGCVVPEVYHLLELATRSVSDEQVKAAAKIRFAEVVPLGDKGGYTVAVGSLGLKLYTEESDAALLCAALNTAIAAIISKHLKLNTELKEEGTEAV